MGLRPLDPDRWLVVDGHREEELLEKQRLGNDPAAHVLAVLAGSEAAAADVLAAVVSHLERHHPGLVLRRPDGVFEDTTTGAWVDPAALHPIDAAARLVQEDLCLMERIGGRWLLTAASVSFPSRWSLADKVGRDLAGIHAPVPGFADQLGAPAVAVFDRLRVERPVWRRNWTVLDDPRLHQPQSPAASDVTDPGRQLWFRVERQTLRRLTDRPAITFTIGTTITSLGELVADDPSVATALLTTLPSVPPATLAYKGWERLVGPLRSWLSAVEAAPQE